MHNTTYNASGLITGFMDRGYRRREDGVVTRIAPGVIRAQADWNYWGRMVQSQCSLIGILALLVTDLPVVLSPKHPPPTPRHRQLLPRGPPILARRHRKHGATAILMRVNFYKLITLSIRQPPSSREYSGLAMVVRATITQLKLSDEPADAKKGVMFTYDSRELGLFNYFAGLLPETNLGECSSAIRYNSKLGAVKIGWAIIAPGA